ncbi:MAG: hypothetical protein K8F60_12225 [Melioribacteraceae bacterium]|nr:hypothetical protein [Melioribacteraceae bacterium]
MNTKVKKTINFISIIAVFALTGSSTAFLSGLFMNWLGVKPWTFGYFIGWLFFIFPLYQVLTIVYAFIFRQFDFFYSRQKKIAKKLIELIKKNKVKISRPV